MRVAPFIPVLALLLSLAVPLTHGPVFAGNVTWSVGDAVSACPAGDSVVAGHPAVLRVVVNYRDGSGNNKAGVPPESVWVTLKGVTGIAQLQDATDASDGFSWKVFADDSTTTDGDTRFSIVGFTGCGDLYLRLYVSGISQGTTPITVRSLDADGHDPVTAAIDSVYACDFDYSGSVTSADYALLHTHEDHSHRNALHGTLVRRTTACAGCEDHDSGTIGEGVVTWNPANRRLTFSMFAGPYADCSVFITPASPADGNILTQVSFPPDSTHDYDPDWSPLGHELVFDRGDSTVYRRGFRGWPVIRHFAW